MSITFNNLKATLSLIAAIALVGTSTAQADTYSAGFESPSFNVGSIDNQEGWSVWNDSNGPVEEITAAEAYLSTQSWRVSNEWVNGVVQHENTPALTNAVTEAGPFNRFTAKFNFKAASATGDGSLIQISPDDAGGGRLGGRIDITHVPTTVAPFDGRTNSLDGLQLHWDTITGVDAYVSSPVLDASKWYHVSLAVDLVAGTNGGAPNDLVNLVVTDAATNAVVWDVNSNDDGISTWESAGFGGTSLDRLTFRHKWQWTGNGFQEGVDGINSSLASQPQGFYIDDLSISTAVPEPASIVLFGIAGTLTSFFVVQRRRHG